MFHTNTVSKTNFETIPRDSEKKMEIEIHFENVISTHHNKRSQKILTIRDSKKVYYIEIPKCYNMTGKW